MRDIAMCSNALVVVDISLVLISGTLTVGSLTDGISWMNPVDPDVTSLYPIPVELKDNWCL